MFIRQYKFRALTISFHFGFQIILGRYKFDFIICYCLIIYCLSSNNMAKQFCNVWFINASFVLFKLEVNENFFPPMKSKIGQSCVSKWLFRFKKCPTFQRGLWAHYLDQLLYWRTYTCSFLGSFLVLQNFEFFWNITKYHALIIER